MKEEKYVIPRPKPMPYGAGIEKNFKKHLEIGASENKESSIVYAFKRLRNYICCILAYFLPSNKVRVALNRWKGIHIADDAYIGMFCFFDNAHPEYIFIEKNVSISKGASIVAHNNPQQHFDKTLIASIAPIVLREGCLIALDCIIMPGVEVGEYAIVSAGSVVYKNVKPMMVVRGNPAEEIRAVRLSKELEDKVKKIVEERDAENEAQKQIRKQEKERKLLESKK